MALVTLKGRFCSYQFNPRSDSKEGGTGRVFKGQVMESRSPDIAVGTYVAVKVMYRDMASNVNNIMRDEQAARVRINHPNLLRMYEFIEAKGVYHSISEWLDGETLDVRLKRLAGQQSTLSQLEIEAINDALLNALDCLHNQHPIVYHRDVKPGNVMLCHNGTIKLIDFGVAKVRQDLEKGHTLIGTVLGTPNYAPPEQINGEHDLVNPSSDIYAWGNMVYELFHGRPPFEGNQFEVMRMQVEKELPEDVAQLPEPFRSAVQKATRKVQLHRFQSVQEVRAALVAPSPPPPPPPVAAINWHQLVAGTFWVLLSGAVIWVIWMVYSIVHPPQISPEQQEMYLLNLKQGKALFQKAQIEKATNQAHAEQLLHSACECFSKAAAINPTENDPKIWQARCCNQ